MSDEFSIESSAGLLKKEDGMSKKIEKFEDFIAWQKARKLTADIYRATSRDKFCNDFGLKDQIRRAAGFEYVKHSGGI